MLDLSKFKVYVVGGYVRNRLLQFPTKDHDFVVVGATPQDMIDAGFSQVGADFPVFISPLGDEFALARTERKVGNGYHGFEVKFDPTITLYDDLYRRDLTINSMARAVIGWKENGHAILSDEIIDYFGGQQDLQDRIMRPVSDAFDEDPVRVLRVARFSAEYDFRVSSELAHKMEQIALQGDLDFLTRERVWLEVEKVMKSKYPSNFFKVLYITSSMCSVFPGLDRYLYDICENIDRVEGDVYRFASFGLGLPNEVVNNFFDSLKAPNHLKRLSHKTQFVYDWTKRLGLAATTDDVITLFNTLDVIRHPDDFTIAIYSSFKKCEIPNIARLLEARCVFVSVKAATLAEEGIDISTMVGQKIGETIKTLRHQRVKEVWEK